MAFFHCSDKFPNAVDHIMVTQRNFIHSGFYNVSRTRCSNMVNNGRGSESDPSWFLNKLFEAEQLVEIKHVLRIVIYGLFSLFWSEITISVPKEDCFFTLFFQNRENFFQLIDLLKDPKGSLGGRYQARTKRTCFLAVQLQYR